MPFGFPDFRGATRRLILANLIAYFALAVASLALSPPVLSSIGAHLSFIPEYFLRGWIWQPLTYSLIHPPGIILGVLFELLSLWFLADRWSGLKSLSYEPAVQDQQSCRKHDTITNNSFHIQFSSTQGGACWQPAPVGTRGCKSNGRKCEGPARKRLLPTMKSSRSEWL